MAGRKLRLEISHVLAQIYTANHATFPIQYTKLQYRFAVISEAPSMLHVPTMYIPRILRSRLVSVLELGNAAQLVGLLTALLRLELHVRLELGPQQHRLDDARLYNIADL